MPAQAMKELSIGIGICCCHPPIPCIPMSGPILTGSGDAQCNSKGIARLSDIVIGYCGHTGVLITSSSTVGTNSRGNVRIGDQFVGCFSGTIITGSSNTVTGG